MIRIIVRLVLALIAVAALYFAAAMAGSAIPVNRDWRQAESGTLVYVIDNGIHTDVVLPAHEFADLVRPEHLADPRQAGRAHLALGWGDRGFYLNTPTWWDVNPLRIAAAMVGAGPTVVHASFIDAPRAGPKVKPLILNPAQYRQLVAFVRRSFAPGVPVHGYGSHDAFYVARGGYSAFNTCNQWTGRALRSAGVRMGAWTPFAGGVMRWL